MQCKQKKDYLQTDWDCHSYSFIDWHSLSLIERSIGFLHQIILNFKKRVKELPAPHFHQLYICHQTNSRWRRPSWCWVKNKKTHAHPTRNKFMTFDWSFFVIKEISLCRVCRIANHQLLHTMPSSDLLDIPWFAFDIPELGTPCRDSLKSASAADPSFRLTGTLQSACCMFKIYKYNMSSLMLSPLVEAYLLLFSYLPFI